MSNDRDYAEIGQLLEGNGKLVAAALREGLNSYSTTRPENVTDEDLAVLEELASEVEYR